MPASTTLAASSRAETRLLASIRVHADAVAAYRAAAERLPAAVWRTPTAPGKWSPAEITEHLALVYDVLGRELAGGAGMALRTRWWQRVVLRSTLLPHLLAGGRFPAGVRAPREVRPAGAAAAGTAAAAAESDAAVPATGSPRAEPQAFETGASPAGAHDESAADTATTLAAFAERAAAFDRAVHAAFRTRRGATLTHAYLGRLSLTDVPRFCGVHVLHHLGQLPVPGDQSGDDRSTR